MLDTHIISILMFLPIVGVFFIMAIKREDQKNAKLVALWTTFFVSVFSLILLFGFDFSKSQISNIQEFDTIPGCNIKYSMFFDKFSIFFVPLISVLCFLSILWLFKKNIPKARHFLISLLIFEALSIGAFCASDMFLLFIFMEATVIPLYIMLFCWEKERNTESILQFVIYSIASALIVLIAIILIYAETNTANLFAIYKIGVKNAAVFWLLFIGIAIKMPIWPFYHWLPNIHVKSPTVCSVLLASVVLKFSTLLIIRFVDPIFLKVLFEHRDLIFNISIISMIFATTQLIFENDLKRFFAYFSILHMNMYFLILLSGLGKKYFIFAIMQHSVVMAILFFSTDVIKTTLKTRLISELKTITIHFANIKNLMFLCTLILIGVPVSWGFVAEILSIYSCCKVSIYYAFASAAAILLSSMYAFYLYHSIFGSWKENDKNILNEFHISNVYKQITLCALFFFVVFFGIFPGLILNRL